ncbi:MAG: MFS transporter [Thermoleophilales bacterium]|nr:MFS transporter [Thermoleophilales bacterium]
MDATIVNVALPSIQKAMDASVSGLQWAVASYSLVLASLLILGGSSADRFGRVRIFRTGLCVFTLASIGCAFSPDTTWLIVFRMLQGVGASMLNPVAMSIIRNIFTDPAERARAIGMWAAVFGLSMALGPIIGGFLTELDWRAVFLVNVPIGILAFVLTGMFIPESKATRFRRPDPIGQVLAFVLLATLTGSLIEGPNLGWDSTWVIAAALVAATALVAFVRHELRRSEPLIELRFFRSRPFTMATVTAILAFGAFSGFMFVNTLYLQDGRGFSPIEAGLSLVPMALATMIAGPVSGRLVASRGVRLPLMAGGAAMVVAGILLVPLAENTSLVWLYGAYAVFGLGFGLVNPPITNTAVSGMPASQAGVAAAVASTSRMVGQTLGVAVIGGLVTAAANGPLRDQIVDASQPAWWLVVALSGAIILLGYLSSTPEALGTARKTAARFEIGEGEVPSP